MTYFEAILLGVVQGLTEFLPVSSSGHLTLLQAVLGMKNIDEFILFDLVCHIGTLLAIFVIFWKEICAALGNKGTLACLFVGTLPLVPLALFLKPLKSLFDQPETLGFFFWVTGLLLFAGMRWGHKSPQKSTQEYSWGGALMVGFFQAAAVVPGISRSGATIAGARLAGWPMREAVRFSFLLAIPAILGGTGLEVMMIALGKSAAAPELGLGKYFLGFLCSFLTGLSALKSFIHLAEKNKFQWFIAYCFAVGLFCLYYF